ncbi:hypothetical protein [Schaalia sp. Marseille-Q2122]|uniref:hypothetical protein n=1 Tax=Schaalia sp. Marseille-Q2122 TaxID=2736604 RepID=UPI001C37E254|nr:hypothetical protein [Schaalia sp. Marseille-Q2122]
MSIHADFEGRPEVFFALEQWLRHRVIPSFENSESDLRFACRRIEDDWAGETAQAASQWAKDKSRACGEILREISPVIDMLYDYGTCLDRVQKSAEQIRQEARDTGLTVVGDTIYPPEPNGPDDDQYLRRQAIYEDLSYRMEQLRSEEYCERAALESLVPKTLGDWVQAFDIGTSMSMASVVGYSTYRGTKWGQEYASALDDGAKALKGRVLADPVAFGGGKLANQVLNDVDAAHFQAQVLRSETGAFKVTPTAFKVAGGGLAVGGMFLAGYEDYQNGETLVQAGVSNAIAGAVSVGASAIASAGASAAMGAAFGSVVPGLGTVVGALVGIGVGIVVYTCTDNAVDSFFEN